ncbi:YoaK family protein [Alkanindiges sp. WGS2144]|uniref:YoaK family protein n=1 Tax=Alkanindiges sp. WGS2144 TaxID=3366808 RepID=UPI00375194DD
MPLQTLPTWIQVGAFLLALNAGMINILAIFNVAHQTISHMTGNVSYLVLEMLQRNWLNALFLLGVIFFFVLGSFYSGFIIRDATLRLGHRYGVVLILEALFLFITWLLIDNYPHYALLWAATACGMQNALASTYNGTIIRTTHLSGVLTDLGLALGYRARGLYVNPKRILLHSLIVLGFFAGGVIGGLNFYMHPDSSFLYPTLLTTLLAFIYWFFYLKQQR